MTLIINLPPKKEATLKAVAQAQGVTAEKWLQNLMQSRRDNMAESSSPARETGRPLSARVRELWANLPDDARAEYPEGGAYQIDHHVYCRPKPRPDQGAQNPQAI